MSRLTAFVHHRLLVLLLVSLGGYALIGYTLDRSQFVPFILTYGTLWACYWAMVRVRRVDRGPLPESMLLAGAMVPRLVLLCSLPTLSDDFYRFIWDGNLLIHSLNPFLHPPEYYMQSGLPTFLSADLFEQLNSPSYFTVYPPVNQYLFGTAAAVAGTHAPGAVLVMKTVVLAAEFGTCLLLMKLLRRNGLSARWMMLYAFNPLVILELAGNLHLESLMIFFLLAAWYCWQTGRLWGAAVLFMLAANTKLIPLLLMPYLCFSLGWKRASALVGVLAGGTVLLHIPFAEGAFLTNFGESLGLYFQSFEFNAGIYYLVRWVGFQVEGYNIIQTAAPRLALLATVGIVWVGWWLRNGMLRTAARALVVSLGIYYLLSTTVHPWYITPLLAFTPFVGLRFPIVWSAVIPLSYSAYRTPAYSENLWLVALEYSIVFFVMAYEWYSRNEQPRENLHMIQSAK